MWNKQQDCRAEKELRYSIRKYKFGAASVAIAALMFLGAHVASADTINGKNQSTADLVKAKDESLQDGTDKPENVEESKETAENKVDVELNPVKHEKPTTTESLLKTADKSQLRTVLEELNGLLSTPLNLDSSLLSSIKDRVQRGQAILSSADAVQKNVDELASLLKSDVATLSQANKETNRPKEELANDKTEPTESEAKKKSDESSNKENEVPTNKNDSLKLSLEQLKAALLELPDHETTKEVLEKANDVISLAQGAVSNTGVTTSELEDLNKRVKRTFNSVKIATMRLNSGSHDPRNGQSIPRGIQFRAYTPISSSGALKNVKYYASVDPKDNGGRKTRNNEPEFTENKTVIKAVYEQNSSGKWMVYDIFFNNDGRAMVEQSYGQHYYFQPPFNIMDGSNRVENLTITRYRNVGGRRLSDGGSGFEKVGNTIVISNPWQQKDKIFDGDRRSLYDPNSGVSRSNQKPQVFKNNKDDGDLDKIVRKTDGNYTGGVSYTLGMEVGKVSTPYAIHMTARVKLKDNITEQDAANGNVYAASVTSARNTNQSYIVGSLGTSLTPKDTTPPTINANGATVIKNEKIVDIPVTAVDNTGGVGMRPNNPIEVTGLPQGLTFANGKITGTPTGPVGNSTVTIKAYDKNGNKAEKTITITVKDQASKYNPTGETLTVNQGQTITDDAVKAKVKNYAPGSLTVLSKPSTAKPGNVGNAVVKVTYPDGSTENVNVPVTVLEAPDNQPPTLAISPANQTVVEGEKVTFTVTAKDNKVVTIDGKDFTTKYGTRLLSGKATNTNVKITDTEKVTTITITTTAEDVGKTNTITFNASDNAGNKAKPVTFTFNVTPRDTQKPEATLNGVRLTETANSPIFTVYRGATFNPELKVWDNSGVISKVTTGNLPYGITASTFTAQTGKTEKTPYTTRLSSGTVLNTQTLGDHIGTLHVEGSSATDSRDLKFKYRVVDIESKNLENGVAKVPVGSTLNVANSRKNIDSHNYLKVVDSEDKADRGNNYLPSGMTWTWKQGDKLEPGTTLDNSGKYTRNATAIFPTSVSDVNSTTRKTFAPTEIKRPVVLAVTPTAPSVVANENGTVTITPPTRPNSTTPQDIDTITLTYTPTGKTTPETVTVTKSGNNWTVNGKTTDKVSVTPAGVVTISDPEVADGKEVTAKVSKRIDNNLTLESPIAKEIAKGAKPQTPVVTAKDNGEVTAKPQDPAKVDKITVSYIGEDNQPQTAVGKKDPKGNWTVDKPEVRINPKTGEITIPENKVKDGTEVTVVTKNGNSADSDPAKAVAKDAIKPEATLNGVRLTENANTPVFTVYRGATFNPELKVWDNTGIISKVEVKEGLPKGVTSSTFTSQTGKTEANPYAIRLSSGTVLNTETLGVHESTLHVEGSSATDSRDFKFKYRVVDIETRNMENGIAKVPVGSTLNVANSGKNIDAHRYLKVVDSEDKADRGNNYLPSGMTWTWKQGDKLETGTTLDNSGKYTRNATAIFPDTSKNSITDVNSTTRTTFAPVEIKRQVVLAVTPTVPSVVGNEDGSVTITPPTRPNSTTPQDIDAITITYTPTGKTNPETVTVTKSGNNWTVNGKSADKVSVTPAGVVTISDAEVADKTDITAKVSKKIDNNLTLESPVARGTANGPLAAEVTNPAPVPEKSPITPVIVVTPNKPGSSITTDKPVNGLTVDDEGKLKGTPTVDNWEPKEEERTVEIPVKLKKGTEEVVVKVPVKIQRDTDGDGIPDVKDPDDDNDGIPDEEEITNGTDPKTPTTQTPTIEITQQPNGNAIVTPKKPDGKPYPPGTKVEIPGKDGNPITVTIGDNGSGEVPNDKLPKKAVPGKGTVTEPNKNPSKPVDVTTPAHKTPKLELDQDPETGDVTVTPKKPDGSTFPPGTKVEIPGENGPITVTIGEDGKGKVPNSELPDGKVPGTGKITEPGKPTEEVPVETPSKIIPGAPTTEQPVEIEINQKPNGDAVVTPKKEDGKPYPSGTKVEIPGEDKDGNPITITVTIGDNGSGEVPNDKLPKKDIPGKGKVTEPNKKPSQPVDVTTPAHKTPKLELEQDPKTGDVTVTPKKPDGSQFPPGTKVEIPGKDKDHPITVTIGEDGKGKVPNADLPEGKVPGTGKITEPGKPTEEVPVETPAHKTPKLELEQDPKTGDVTVTPKKPDGSTYPPGTKVEIPGKDGNPITVTIGEDGKGKVPNSELPDGKVPGTAKITEPGQPTVEVPVETPAKVTPETPTTEKPGKIEITQQPNGNAIVTPKKPDGSTYPPGTKVEIPGENGTTITVTIGDNGSGEVPNDNLPKKDVPGTGTVTEPNKKPSQPVDVTTPARKTPTLDVEQDPKTGDVTVTPKKPDGSTYPPGTKVEIPGKDGNPITVTIGEDGKGKVPNSELPEGKVPGTAKITEPGQPAVEVPVETPAKVTPETPVTEKPGKIEITQQPNGNAIVTPKKPDGSTYPPGTTVEIPGENGTPITVTIGDNGSGEVPNDKLPKGNVPGKGTVTEPNKKPSQPVDVTTPARKTPTVDVEQDPKTGDVTVTPKKPDGSTYPPGTKVEIPGKDGNPITVIIGEDGKGKVPNSELPEGKVPGTAKITEPDKPTVEVPDVTTPGKVTPSTPTDTNPVAPVTPDMPVKPDTNGGSGQDTPAPATPNADQVDTKTTVDNGAKSNDSQNVLPNTGTESNAALASLGLLGLLSGFGLVARKKKED